MYAKYYRLFYKEVSLALLSMVYDAFIYEWTWRNRPF